MSTDTLAPTLAQLQDLLTWEHGWNTSHALAPKPEAVSRATTWITDVYQRIADTWAKPNITSDGFGNVVLEWWHKDNYLELFISDNDIQYLRSDGTRMDDGTIAAIDDMQQLWQWLLEETQA